MSITSDGKGITRNCILESREKVCYYTVRHIQVYLGKKRIPNGGEGIENVFDDKILICLFVTTYSTYKTNYPGTV